MDKRKGITARLFGPSAAGEDTADARGYRGERLGLPEEGPGSVAPYGRRFAAIMIDWAACSLIAYGLLADGQPATASNWTLIIFFVMGALTVGTVGVTPGKRLFNLRVVHLSGARLSLPRAALRTLLLSLAIPALIADEDSRGLHDRLAGAVQVRA